jgi:hypothetical protein
MIFITVKKQTFDQKNFFAFVRLVSKMEQVVCKRETLRLLIPGSCLQGIQDFGSQVRAVDHFVKKYSFFKC